MREDSPSSTATLIAAATVFLARDRHVADMVPHGAAQWCTRCLEAVSPSALRKVSALSHPSLRWAARLAERATVPGLLLYFMLRKRWIEHAVRASVAEGSEQVVIVGAGFDTMALRLCAEFPRVRFIEIDHPATQQCKRLAVEPPGLPGNLHFIAADLARERLQDVLAGCKAFRPDARSTIVMEGLLTYLGDDDVARLFMALRELQRAPGRIVFTVMEPTPAGDPAFHNATLLVTWLLSHWREPFQSSLGRNDAARFLERFGYQLADLATDETLRSRYLAPLGRERMTLARGEMIVVAEREAAR